MTILLRLEEIAIAGLAASLFIGLGYRWWLLGVLFLLPDVSMAGYAFGPRVGAMTYNVVHHRGVAIAILGAGVLLAQPLVQAAGLLLLFHASVDRALGYGLKHPDAFQHTHLGTIGRNQKH